MLMPHPVLYHRATKKIIQTPPALDCAYVFILHHHPLRSISSVAQSTRGALGSVRHSPGRDPQSQPCWDLPADESQHIRATLSVPAGKCGSLGSSSHLLMQTSASTCQQCAFKRGTHSLALQSKAWPHPKGASYALQLSSAIRCIPETLQCWSSEVQWYIQGAWVYTSSATQGVFMQLFIKM